MVITLVPGIFDNGASNDPRVYATVRSPGWLGKFTGRHSIKTVDVQREAEQQMQQQQLPEFYLQFLMQRAGQQQVERAVLKHEADRLGLQVSDEDLRQLSAAWTLLAVPLPGGSSSARTSTSTSWSQPSACRCEFEDEVKDDLELQRLQALVTGGVSVVRQRRARAVSADGNQGEVRLRRDLVGSDIKKTINPSDADLQAFFKQSAARYATAIPETRKIEFFSFDSSNLPGGSRR
jgi:peptidyl-prolyl cis-trans isomerase D